MKNTLKVTILIVLILIMSISIIFLVLNNNKEQVLEEEKIDEVEVPFSKGIKDNVIVNPNELEDEYIVYVYSSNCDSCSPVKPVINKYAESVKNSLPVYAYDIDDSKNEKILDYFVSKGLIYNGNPNFGYFYNDELYSNVLGEFKVEEVPSAGSYKELEPIEIKTSEDANNHSHEYEHEHEDEK